MGRLLSAVREYPTFISEFISDARSIGALTPSSQALAELITSRAHLATARSVVELGPGTGVFTKKLVEKIPPHSDFFALETNERFVESTRDQGVTVYHDSAENLSTYLSLRGQSYCDCIISGLPFAGFDCSLQQRILDSVITSLRPGGEFLTFAYLQGTLLPQGRRFKRRLDELFSTVDKTDVVWNNFPPAFVYHCTK